MNRATASLIRMTVACVAIAAFAPAAAQSFPTKPSRIVVPIAAGGLHDILMRGVAQELSKIWRQPVIIENRPGATHIVATEYVVRSAPDGYTILMDDRSMIGNAVLLPGKLSYDALRDLAPVANVIRIPNGVFVRSDFPANSLREFVDYARKNPAKVNYGSFGIASPPHIIIEGMSKQFGIQLTHIPYKGIAEVIPALLGGQIQFGLGGVSVLVPLAREGKIRVLASGSKRSTLMPDVPTYAEVGVTLKSLSWTGLFVPAATPRSVIAKIAQDLKTVFSSPDFASKFVEGVGLETDYLGTEEFAQMLREDLKVYGSEIKDMNIKLD